MIHGDRGRLPASYANFYIGNEVVLVPVFDAPQDAQAIDVLTSVFRRAASCRSTAARSSSVSALCIA